MSNQSSSSENGNGGASLIRTVCMIIAMILMIVWIKGCVRNTCEWVVSKTHRIEKRINRWGREIQSFNPPRSDAAISPSTSLQTWRTFDIPEDGLRVHLDSTWKIRPIGGNITIATPQGRIYHDEPGVQHNVGSQPAGIYTLRASPPGAKRQVRINTRW